MVTEADNTQASYNRVAKAYADYYVNEFDHKPLDRELLDRLVSRVKGKGRVCDLGCGPGMVAAYLHGRGAEAMGIDLSPGMLEQARMRGFIDTYRGVRITGTGRRFMVDNALIWNVLDEDLQRIGQAATFSQWTWLR